MGRNGLPRSLVLSDQQSSVLSRSQLERWRAYSFQSPVLSATKLESCTIRVTSSSIPHLMIVEIGLELGHAT